MSRDVPLSDNLEDSEPVASRKASATSESVLEGIPPPRRRLLPLDIASSLAVAAALIIGLLPIILYWLFIARLPTLTALEARQLLTDDEQVALVDIRDPATFSQGHVGDSINWPYQTIMQLDSADSLPEDLAGKELLLLSGAGLPSARATRRLLDLSLPVWNIHGGMQAWISTSATLGKEVDLWRYEVPAEAGLLPTRMLKPGEQLATVTASTLIKPVYMIMTLLLIMVFWKSREADLASLRWALILFLAGEIACVFNTATYFTSGEQSDLFEYLHGLGMVLCLGLICYTLLEGLDRRVVHVNQARRRCALLPLCRSCYKVHDVSCTARRAFIFITPAIAALAFIPLTAQPDATSYNASLYGLPFNFSHPSIHQFYEIRYLPIVALGLLAVALAILLFRKNDSMVLAKIPFSAGIGALGYSMLMLVLYAAFRDNLVWFIFWEEGTELLLIVSISAIVWLFRTGLLAGNPTLLAKWVQKN